jgi:hypothetical protein
MTKDILEYLRKKGAKIDSAMLELQDTHKGCYYMFPQGNYIGNLAYISKLVNLIVSGSRNKL